jgi:hypothetical protein
LVDFQGALRLLPHTRREDNTWPRLQSLIALTAFSSLRIYPVSKNEVLGLVLGGVAFGIAFQAAPYAVGWLFGQSLASPLLRRLIIAGMGAALAFWFWAWYATFINIAEPDAQDALTMVVVPAYAAIGMTILGGVLAVIDHFLRSSE